MLIFQFPILIWGAFQKHLTEGFISSLNQKIQFGLIGKKDINITVSFLESKVNNTLGVTLMMMQIVALTGLITIVILLNVLFDNHFLYYGLDVINFYLATEEKQNTMVNPRHVVMFQSKSIYQLIDL